MVNYKLPTPLEIWDMTRAIQTLKEVTGIVAEDTEIMGFYSPFWYSTKQIVFASTMPLVHSCEAAHENETKTRCA